MNEAKKAPGTADSYDREIAVMKRCKTLIRSLPLGKRHGVVMWLGSAVQDDGQSSHLPPAPPDARQKELF